MPGGHDGEVDPKYLKGVLLASVMGTPHEGQFHLEYAWEVIRRENCQILQPSGCILAEDIRWQWVTYQNLLDLFVRFLRRAIDRALGPVREHATNVIIEVGCNLEGEGM